MNIKVLLIVAVVLTVSLLGVGPASAATHQESDRRGDAPPRLDITRVLYRNGPQAAVARIGFVDLLRRGKLTFQIAPPTAGDVSYVAILTINDRGRLVKRFGYRDNASTHPRRCRVSARWQAGRDVITVSVPQWCVRAFGGRALYMGSFTPYDFGPVVRHLARG